MPKMNTLLIIDGLNLVRRMHAAQPNEDDTAALPQRVGGACIKLLKQHHPTHVVAVWDGNEVSWRKQLFADYKKGRKPMPDALAAALDQLKDHLKSLGIGSIDAPSEADDVIATLAVKISNSHGQAIIVSTDKGFGQLFHHHIKLWDYFAHNEITTDAIEHKIGVKHHQFIDYLALTGDSSHKLPGVPGIGAKSAANLLKDFNSLKDIYAALDKITATQANKLAQGKPLARLSYRLAKLQTDLRLDTNLNHFRVKS